MLYSRKKAPVLLLPVIQQGLGQCFRADSSWLQTTVFEQADWRTFQCASHAPLDEWKDSRPHLGLSFCLHPPSNASEPAGTDGLVDGEIHAQAPFTPIRVCRRFSPRGIIDEPSCSQSAIPKDFGHGMTGGVLKGVLRITYGIWRCTGLN